MAVKNQQSEIVQKTLRKKAFTLPEVIISFSVMAMVITSAVSILSVVMRTNADNVSSLMANGLAQEGIEAVRFIRDSNVYLGLDFNGAKKNSNAVGSFWGSKLFEKNSLDAAYFKLFTTDNTQTECNKLNLNLCLPLSLVSLTGDDWKDLSESDTTIVYLDEGSADSESQTVSKFRYFQSDDSGLISSTARPTPFHRVIRVEPIKPETNEAVSALRVNSIVTWEGINGMPRKVVLTTNLTNWR